MFTVARFLQAGRYFLSRVARVAPDLAIIGIDDAPFLFSPASLSLWVFALGSPCNPPDSKFLRRKSDSPKRQPIVHFTDVAQKAASRSSFSAGENTKKIHHRNDGHGRGQYLTTTTMAAGIFVVMARS